MGDLEHSQLTKFTYYNVSSSIREGQSQMRRESLPQLRAFVAFSPSLQHRPDLRRHHHRRFTFGAAPPDITRGQPPSPSCPLHCPFTRRPAPPRPVTTLSASRRRGERARGAYRLTDATCMSALQTSHASAADGTAGVEAAAVVDGRAPAADAAAGGTSSVDAAAANGKTVANRGARTADAAAGGTASVDAVAAVDVVWSSDGVGNWRSVVDSVPLVGGVAAVLWVAAADRVAAVGHEGEAPGLWLSRTG